MIKTCDQHRATTVVQEIQGYRLQQEGGVLNMSVDVWTRVCMV